MTRLWKLFSVAAVVSATGIAGCERGRKADASELRGRVLPEPRPKIDFTLTDTDGRPFDFAEETEGYVALLFFGYTNCPDVCPIHMANLGAVLADFPPELRRQFKVVFVTTDPERDRPERLREWLDNFDPEFIGLWGSHGQVNAIETALGLPASVRPTDDGADYEVGHAAGVVAFTKDNRAHVIYPFGTRQADWAHDLPKLARQD